MNNFIANHLVKLKKNNILYPEIELRALLQYSSLINNEIFLSNFHIDNININKFKSAFKRRILQEPFSKISNSKEFWSLDFYVNNNVLDPRPESEFLIAGIKEYFTNFNKKIKICDLGTGSGCLAITLAKLYNRSKVVATDISKDAIKVAKFNAKKYKLKNQIKFFNCKWINKIEKYDVIVSNPPYLSYSQYEKTNENIIKFEPRIALVGGRDGLKKYKEISSFSSLIMHKNSYLFIEIGKDQRDNVISIFEKSNFKIVKIFKDYQSIDRVLVIKKEYI